MADRLDLGDRVRGREDGTWFLVEQHAFATLESDRVSQLDLVCPGFRGIEQPA